MIRFLWAFTLGCLVVMTGQLFCYGTPEAECSLQYQQVIVLSVRLLPGSIRIRSGFNPLSRIDPFNIIL